jgi:hypothetical protein
MVFLLKSLFSDYTLFRVIWDQFLEKTTANRRISGFSREKIAEFAAG